MGANGCQSNYTFSNHDSPSDGDAGGHFTARHQSYPKVLRMPLSRSPRVVTRSPIVSSRAGPITSPAAGLQI